MNVQTLSSQMLSALFQRGYIYETQWPAELPFSPAQLGLERVNDTWQLALIPQLLEPAVIERALSDRSIRYFESVDSTNTQMMALGQQDSVEGLVYLAEFQYGGKGRRGRQWVSPFGRNLAISMGFATRKPLAELGGLSIVVGLAVADVLEKLGVENLALKWPNDLLNGNGKLGGILTELMQRGQQTEFVVGLGVNVELTDKEAQLIGQPVSDLRRAGVQASRTELAISLVQSISRYLEWFENQGFAPFVSAFNDMHLYQGKTCTLMQGDAHVVGVVEGIGLDGELILRTDQGEQRFHGGEVSLRSSVR